MLYTFWFTAISHTSSKLSKINVWYFVLYFYTCSTRYHTEPGKEKTILYKFYLDISQKKCKKYPCKTSWPICYDTTWTAIKNSELDIVDVPKKKNMFQLIAQSSHTSVPVLKVFTQSEHLIIKKCSFVILISIMMQWQGLGLQSFQYMDGLLWVSA